MNIEEKRLRRYVIATLDTPTLYLHRTPTIHNDYGFTDDIDYAMKLTKRSDANCLRNYYIQHESHYIDLVIVPIDIVYELINESE